MKFNKDPEVGGGGSGFLKLKDGEHVIGIFLGEPLEYNAKVENKRYVPCDESDPDARFRFRINFVIYDNSGFQIPPIIWEQGAKVYNQLKELNEDYDLSSTFVKIKRKGIELNTEYVVLPSKTELDANMRAQLVNIEPNDLTPKAAKSAISTATNNDPFNDAPAPDDGDVPF